MVVRSMLMSWRDYVRRGRWRPFLWTLINGRSMYSLTLVLKMLQNLSSASFLNPQTLIYFSLMYFCQITLLYLTCQILLMLFSSRFPCQLCCLHGPRGASRKDHGTGPSRWGSPHTRLHDGEEEDLSNVHLL